MSNRLPDFDAWAMFALVADRGGLSAAARELGGLAIEADSTLPPGTWITRSAQRTPGRRCRGDLSFSGRGF